MFIDIFAFQETCEILDVIVSFSSLVVLYTFTVILNLGLFSLVKKQVQTSLKVKLAMTFFIFLKFLLYVINMKFISTFN